MLSESELKHEHESGVFEDRIQRLQAVREAVRAYCGLEVPRNVAAAEDWYKDHKSVMTKKLNSATEDEQDDEPSGGDE